MTLKKYIPDTLTAMNIVCGLVGVVFVLHHRLDLAFYCMLAASVFDFLDGTAARLLDAYSDLGKELDSLCDLVSFGFLPALMLSELMQTYRFDGRWICWLPLVLTVFSALRLAKFNVDERQSSGFLGRPRRRPRCSAAPSAAIAASRRSSSCPPGCPVRSSSRPWRSAFPSCW